MESTTARVEKQSERKSPRCPPAFSRVIVLGHVLAREHAALVATHTCLCDCRPCYELDMASYYIEQFMELLAQDFLCEDHGRWPVCDKIQDWLEAKLGSSFIAGGPLYTVGPDNETFPGETFTVDEDPPAVVKAAVLMQAINDELGVIWQNLDDDDYRRREINSFVWLLDYPISAIYCIIRGPAKIEELADELVDDLMNDVADEPEVDVPVLV